MCPQNFATFVLTPHIHAMVIIKTLPLDNLDQKTSITPLLTVFTRGLKLLITPSCKCTLDTIHWPRPSGDFDSSMNASWDQ